jgi:ferritin
MLNRNLEAAINDQIKHELYSAYFYLSMSAWADEHGYSGSAKWLGKQAKEEQEHAMKFFEHVQDRNGKIVLQAIPQPPAEFASLLDVFEQVKEHEGKVTALITRLYEIALKENDYAGQIMLQWFISEQVEEEKNATTIVDALRAAGGQVVALFMVDRWLGDR